MQGLRLSDEEADIHKGEAMANEIIPQLKDISEFDRVSFRTSTTRYKDSGKHIPEVAGELRVYYIIEGSIQPPD